MPLDTFENRLVLIRRHAGNITAKDAAARIGVSGQTWRNWEAGDSIGARRPAMLAYIARTFTVDESWLRDGGPLELPPDPNPNGGGTSLSGVTVSHFDLSDLLAA